MSFAATGCPHCGTLVEGGGFCCTGCEAAAALMAQLDLGAWLERRQAPGNRPAAAPLDPGFVVVDLPGGLCAFDARVDGGRCDACDWLVETALSRTDGVQRAMVSRGTARLNVVFDPTKASLASLAGRVSALGYRLVAVDAPERTDVDLLVRLGVAAFAAGNVMMLAIATYLGWLDGMAERHAAMLRWGSLALSAPVALWAAIPFHRAALLGLANRRLSLDVPISVSIVAMFAHGALATLGGQDGYLDSLTMLVALLLGGRVLEQWGRAGAREAVRGLAAALPLRARRREGDAVRDVDVASLQVGDEVEVGLGEALSVDGVVVLGEGAVDFALMTGESTPREVGPGSPVVAGALVADGALVVRVTELPSAGLASRMDAALAHPRRELPAASAPLARAFTVGTLVVASAVFGVRMALGDVEGAVSRTIAVLVVACPCAVGLAEPLITAAARSAMARAGLLVRTDSAVRQLARVRTAVLDKTGTLTEGRPVLGDVPVDALRWAAGLARSSVHPVSRAIVAAAAARGVALPRAEGVREVPGQGLEGRVDGVGLSLRRGVDGTVLAADDGRSWVLTQADALRPEADDAVAALRHLGVHVRLWSGDCAQATRAVAAAVGGVDFQAAMDPLQKADSLADLEGPVVFVGDGVNDAPALARADVGLAMASGAAIALRTADGVIWPADPRAVAKAIALARGADRALHRAWRRSAASNLVAVALAAFGYVNPLVAAIWMPLSSALVLVAAARVARSS